MSKRLERALAFATQAHGDQVDQAGRPYMEHVRAVVAGTHGKTAKVIAALHDVLEDTEATYADIDREFGRYVADQVFLLSNPWGGSRAYQDFIEQIAPYPVARRVKIADLRHNMDLSRLPAVTEKDRKRQERYQVALDYLLSFEGNKTPDTARREASLKIIPLTGHKP